MPSIFLSALSGYAFARFRFRGAGLLFGFLLLGLVVPLQAIVIPLFYLLKELGMLNSYWGLILPQGVSALRSSCWSIAPGRCRATAWRLPARPCTAWWRGCKRTIT